MSQNQTTRDISLLHKSLITGLVSSLLLATGIFNVLGAFVRTNISGQSISDCGYGYGYTSFGYGYGYGYGIATACPSYSIGGGRYVYTPLDSELKALASATNTGSTSTGTTNTGSNDKNPYGSRYIALDDGLGGRDIDPDTALDSGLSDPDDGAGSLSPKAGLIRRMLPATGIR